MKPIFADIVYWLALLNPADDWHQFALQYARQNPNIDLVTTDGILDEVLNYASTRGTLMRQKALALYTQILEEPTTTVIAYTPKLRELGFALYAKRSDKAYRLTDCIAMIVMEQMNISAVLTYDQHFTQEGFVILFTEQDRPSEDTSNPSS